MELINRKTRAQLMLISLCAFGCTCASVSGTLAALNHGTEVQSQMQRQQLS